MLLSGFVSLSPITTIIACNKKDQKNDEESNIDKSIELFNTIKTKISDKLSDSEKTKIYLDAKDLKMENKDIKQILDPIFKEAETQEVFVNDNRILDKITEKIKDIVNNLNAELKKIPVLENNNKIISLNSIKARMNGNDIKTLVDLIDQKKYALFTEDNNFDYNLQLNLNFKINIKNKEDSYIYDPKSAFVTSNKKDLENKRSNLADKLANKLQNQELNGKKIIDNVLKNQVSDYSQSFSNELNNVLRDKNIKIKESANMKIDRKELGFQLKNITNDLAYLRNFSKFINEKSNATTTEQMFNEKFENSEFYQFKNYKNKIIADRIYIKDYPEFLVTEWSIEGIELPERTLNNIKIYQEISEIKDSWKQFYKILKYYFDPKHRYNKDLYSNFRIVDHRYNSVEDIKKQDSKKRIEQWIQLIKKQITDVKQTILNNFDSKVIAGNYMNTSYAFPEFGGARVEIQGVSIDLFYQELNFQIINNRGLHYYFKKI